jgi:hypothetical protein
MSLCVAGFGRGERGGIVVTSSQTRRRRATGSRHGVMSGPEREALDLAASIDEAADDLARHGPVAPDDLRRMLADLELEWTNESHSRSNRTTRTGRPAR